MSAVSPSPEEAVSELIRQATELRSQGQVADAVPLLERATRLDPTNIGAWAQLGYPLSLVNRFAEAAWAYQRVVELHPEDATSSRNLGYAFHMRQHPRQALVAYDRAIALYPVAPYRCSSTSALDRLCGRDTVALINRWPWSSFYNSYSWA